MTDVIFHFCRSSPHASILIPSRGLFYGASTRPLRETKPKPGERMGLNWIIRNSNRRATRALQFDTNFYKAFVHQRLRAGMGSRGCMTLFGDDAERHKLFADHLLSEFGTEVEAKGRKVIEFQQHPHRPDNDLLDGVVGCHALASMLGVNLTESQASSPIAVKKVKFSELQKRGTF